MKNYLENVDREALRARAEQMLHYADEARGSRPACSRSVCGSAPAFPSASKSCARCSLWRSRRAGCICSGGSSSTRRSKTAPQEAAPVP